MHLTKASYHFEKISKAETHSHEENKMATRLHYHA